MSTLFSHFFQKFNTISPLESDFLQGLNNIVLKPKILYYYGKMPEKVAKQGRKVPVVAIVGTRHMTKYGEEVAYKLSFELAKRGAIIVSGLAYGVDAVAHRAAVDAGGKTVAILGTPIDEVYPRENMGLAREIIEKGGAILSEYAPGAKIFPKTSFLERNRLISGVADVVVVIEAAERSGSLNTAAHAIDQGKELFAVPGDITRPMSAGCNRLIRQGAMPMLDVKDLLKTVFPEEFRKKRKKSQILMGETKEELAILECILEGVSDGEEICAKIKMETAIFNQTVTLMEIRGVVRGLGANKWAIC